MDHQYFALPIMLQDLKKGAFASAGGDALTL
jgi:hypothetical protein